MKNEYTENIAFIDLHAQLVPIRLKIEKAISNVLDHGQFIMGPEVKEFEKLLIEFTNTKYALTCANGTDALTLALLALDVSVGDVVFVPSFTYVASAEAVALIGAIPYFVDVNPVSFNICPDSLKQAIIQAQRDGHKLKAVIAVELFGNPCALSDIEEIVADNKLKLIVDAAQSFGAEFDGKSTCKFGDLVTTSFFPAKPLGCYGDGGAIFTKSDYLFERLNSLRLHGKGNNKYDNVCIGMNSRLDTIQAAILIEKLKIFPSELVARRRIAQQYTDALSIYFDTPKISENCQSAWAQYTIKTSNRDELKDAFASVSIPTVVYYPIALTKQIGYKHFPTIMGGTEISERLSKEVISLPMHPYLDTTEIIDKIFALLR